MLEAVEIGKGALEVERKGIRNTTRRQFGEDGAAVGQRGGGRAPGTVVLPATGRHRIACAVAMARGK